MTQPNDNCDLDTGANNSQNFPIVTSAVPAVAGTLNSHPNMAFTIEAIGGPTGQPMRPLGTTSVTTGASCTGSWSLTPTMSVGPNWTVVATATDPAGNTSELSDPFVTPPPPPTATVTTSGLVVTALHQQIQGTASDAGGPGLYAVLLYYRNQATGAIGVLPTVCTGCGVGSTTATWSYTPTLGGPLLPGPYTIVAQAIDTNRTFSGASNTTTVVIV